MSSQEPTADGMVTIDSQTAIGFLIATSGNAPLAAVKASRACGGTVTEAQLLLAIASDPTAITYLGSQIRVLAMIQTLDAFRLTHMTYLEKLPKMAPADVARTYTKLLQTITQGVETSAPADGGSLERLLNTLPPKVSQAVRFFVENPGAADELPSPNSITDGSGEAETPGVTVV